MSERLHYFRVFDSVLVSGLASGVVGAMIPLHHDVLGLQGLTFLASSPTSRADIGFEYAIGRDGRQAGSFADYPALLTSTTGVVGISAGWVTVAMPNPLATWIVFRVSGTGSNPVDTRVTCDLLMRLG